MTRASSSAEPDGRKAKNAVRYAGLFLAGGIVLLCLFLMVLHPYARMERAAREVFDRHAPPGATVNAINIAFPFNIVLTNLAVPVQVRDRQRRLLVKKLSGRVSILSFLQGEVKAGMTGDFFGGMLWLDVRAEAVQDGVNEPSFISFDARARGLDIAEICRFLGEDVVISGSCDADAEAELDERDPSTLKGKALVLGEKVEIPAIDAGALILPKNFEAKFTGKFSAKDGSIFVNKFRLEGLAYDLSGKGKIIISDPLDQSPLDCTFSIIFKEPPTITDEKLVDGGAEYVVGALVAAGTEIFFKLKGTARRPDVQFDPASSLGSLLQESGG